MSSEEHIAKIAMELERLANEQKRTADMMESMVYLYADANDSDVQFENFTGQDYWTAIPPWEDR